MDNGAIFLPNVNKLIMLSIIRRLHVQLRTFVFSVDFDEIAEGLCALGIHLNPVFCHI